jgi:hypothetical protein
VINYWCMRRREEVDGFESWLRALPNGGGQGLEVFQRAEQAQEVFEDAGRLTGPPRDI